MNFGVEREFGSAPTMDTERQASFRASRNWSPNKIAIFGHTISVDIPTGNLVVSTSDVAYPYYNFSLGISRKYDAQEQHMQLSYLRNYPNVNPKPHWFGNWQFAYEADVDEVWHSSYPELHVTSGIGANGLFEVKEPDFKRNQRDGANVEKLLKTYGIPGRTLKNLEWVFEVNDFLLRTFRGSFQIIAGHFREETLVDDICADMWLFNPISGSGFRISSEFFFNIRDGRYRDVGFPLVVSKLVDALGHAIELKPSVDQKPFKEYILADGSERTFQIKLSEELTFLDGLNPGGHVRKYLVSEAIDGTKTAYNRFDYRYKPEFLPDNSKLLLLEEVGLPSEPGGRRIRYHYNDDKHPGILTAIENSCGDRIRLEYVEDPIDNDERLNPRLKIKKIIDPEGITFEYEYNHSESTVFVTVSQNGDDRKIKYQYIRDLQNTKQRYITLAEVEVKRGYDFESNGIVERQTTKPQIVANRTEYTNDRRFNVEKEIDPLGRKLRYQYSDFNQLEFSWDFDNHQTGYTYDIPGNPTIENPRRYDLLQVRRKNLIHSVVETQPKRPFIENIKNITKKYEYDKYDIKNSGDVGDHGTQSTHRVHKETDEREKVWTFSYDDPNNHNPLSPTLIESPLTIATQGAMQGKYDNRGQREKVIDAENNVHNYSFNGQGQLEVYIDPNNGRIVLKYNAAGNWLETFEDQLTNETKFEYDVDGRIKQITDPVRDSVNYEYYANGRLHKIIRRRVVQQNPDNPNLEIIEYDKLETEFFYSPLGSLSKLINAKDLKLIFEYDEAGRLSKWYHDVADRKETRYVYDHAGQLLLVADRKGKITEYSYCPNGNIKKIQFPKWDAGNKERDGKTVEYENYDYQGRVLSIKDSEIKPQTPKQFAYDEAGNLVIRRDQDGFELHFSFDDDNRLWRVTQHKGDYELTMDLDCLGRPKELSDTDMHPNMDINSPVIDRSLQWSYRYDKEINQRKKVLNLYTRIVSDINLASNYDYDEKNRLILKNQIWTSPPKKGILTQNVRYRSDDLIDEISGEEADKYNYDGIKQLIYEKTNNEYSDYDEAGNRLYRLDRTNVTVPPKNDYNEQNQLFEEKYLPARLSYDQNGNIERIDYPEPREMFFDGANRLRIIKFGEINIEYTYDSEGRLVTRKTTQGGTDIETVGFHYLISKPILLTRSDQPYVLLTRDPGGNILRIRRYDQTNGQQNSVYPHSLFPIYDCLGNPIRFVTDNRKEAISISYDAWGNLVREDPKATFEYWGYRNGVLDVSTGYLLFGARWYSPIIGRWVSEDPSVEASSQRFTDLSNLYSYVSNNPINASDPSGLFNDEQYDVSDDAFTSTGLDVNVISLRIGLEFIAEALSGEGAVVNLFKTGATRIGEELALDAVGTNVYKSFFAHARFWAYQPGEIALGEALLGSKIFAFSGGFLGKSYKLWNVDFRFTRSIAIGTEIPYYTRGLIVGKIFRTITSPLLLGVHIFFTPSELGHEPSVGYNIVQQP
jgi:RHS repeat-associated protein